MVSKFWRNLRITLAILVEFTLEKTESNFFSPISLSKNGESSPGKKQNHCFSQNLYFSLEVLVCVLLHGRFMFSQQLATNSFLMEEKIHDGSSISPRRRRRRPLLLCCNSGTVI
jgi:hypothetical protein